VGADRLVEVSAVCGGPRAVAAEIALGSSGFDVPPGLADCGPGACAAQLVTFRPRPPVEDRRAEQHNDQHGEAPVSTMLEW